jgi:hypothetical protein
MPIKAAIIRIMAENIIASANHSENHSNKYSIFPLQYFVQFFLATCLPPPKNYIINEIYNMLYIKIADIHDIVFNHPF